MGYWWPPGPASFNPAPRPLSWHGDRIPNEEDAIFFGYGVEDSDMTAWTSHLPRGGVAGAWNPGKARPFLKLARHLSDADILAAYSRLIDARAPEDPPSGGLAADFVDAQGGIHINYYDLADDTWPIRKQVVYTPKKGGVDVAVSMFVNGQWQGEGFDLERDFTTSISPILDAINAVSTAVISIFASPAVGAAWSSAFGTFKSLSDMNALGKLDVGSAIGQAFGALGSGIIQSGAGEALVSEAGPKISSALYKSIGVDFAKGGNDFASALVKAATVAKDLIPKLADISTAQALEGAIPKAFTDFDANTAKVFGAPAEQIPSTFSYAWKIATAAFAALKAGDLDRFYSWRKIGDDPSQVDAMLATLVATDAAEEASRNFQGESFIAARDASATRTLRQALGATKQEAPFTKDDAAKTFKQVALSMGLPETYLAPKRSFPWGKVAIGAALLYVFRDSLRRILP